jgi:hypothetical protein
MLLAPSNRAGRQEDFAVPRPIVVKPENRVYTPTPSEQTYVPLLEAFNHFNKELFGGALPDALITLQRKTGTLGYFSHNKFAALSGDGVAHEIALNPAHFRKRALKDTCSTLAHEMVHLWQSCFGKRPRAGYHDKQWAEKMIEIGLQPSSIGAPGGKTTGYRMDHYIVDGGAFDRSYTRFEAIGQAIGWGDAISPLAAGGNEGAGKKPKREKFVCLKCGLKMYGPKSAKVRCESCDRLLVLELKAAKVVVFKNAAPLPGWIEARLRTAPHYIGRRDLAALHTETLGPLSPRTLEAWPLVWKRVGGYAVTNARDAMQFAWERFESAPEYRRRNEGNCNENMSLRSLTTTWA